MIVGLAGLAGSGKDTVADFLVKNHGFTKVAFADPLKRICRDVYDFSKEQLWGPSSKRNAPDKRYYRLSKPDEVLLNLLEKWHELPNDGEEEPPPAHEYLGITHEEYKCWVETGGYLTPRHALQQLGSEWGRNCYSNTWVDYALRVAHTLLFGTIDDSPGSRPRYSQEDGLTWGIMCPRPKGIVISDVRFVNELEAIRARGGKVAKVLRGKGLEGSAAQHRSETELVGMSEEVFNILIDNKTSTLKELEEHVALIVKNRLMM